MHLYSGSTVTFVADAVQNRVAGALMDAYFQHYRRHPPESEVVSWRNSLRAMAQAIELGGFDDHGIVVELELPLTSYRLDCMLTGSDRGGRRQAVIVELKQWTEVKPSHIEDSVRVWLGGRERDTLHPSCQVGNYQRYLLDVHTAFSQGEVGLHACSYLHNLDHDPTSELLAPRHADLVSKYPLFAGNRVDDLVGHLDAQLGAGAGAPVLEHVLLGRYRPHKRLLQHTAEVLRGDPAYVLLDDQQLVFNDVLAQVRRRNLSSARTTFLIRGGPGTGKSLIALNLLAELSGDNLVTHHATGSKAFTENLRRIVGRRASAQFKYFNSYTGEPPDQADVLILDEAHRIREHSANRFTRADARDERAQVKELVEAAKISVFFIDDLQVVRPGEVGSSTLIKQAAQEAGAQLVEHELQAQFRSMGSERYVSWIENTLELQRTADVLWPAGEEFDFDIAESPEELEALIRQRAADGATARLTAGFCWPWSKPDATGHLVPDVRVGDWSMPWNAKPDAALLAPGIPTSNFWASEPAGLDQVGCVYTAQGFEFDHVGVIFGRDLVYRPGLGWIGQPEFSKDQMGPRRARDPELFTRLVKSTYRVLLTRGLRGCTVYFQDTPTRDFFLTRMDSLHAASLAAETPEPYRP